MRTPWVKPLIGEKSLKEKTYINNNWALLKKNSRSGVSLQITSLWELRDQLLLLST
jgi:hypothetical protein